MSALMDRVFDFLGVESASSDPDEINDVNTYNDEEEIEAVEERKLFGRRTKDKDKVVSMSQSSANSVKMVICQPTSFDQAQEICGFLLERKSIILNLEYVNKDVQRRIIDFVSGGTFSLNGHLEKISNSIFLVAPSNYDIANDVAREEMKSKLSAVSWLRNGNQQ